MIGEDVCAAAVFCRASFRLWILTDLRIASGVWFVGSEFDLPFPEPDIGGAKLATRLSLEAIDDEHDGVHW